MKKIYFITGNSSKLKEAQKIIAKEGIKIIGKDLKIKEINDIEQEKVLIEKARRAFNLLKKPVIVDDTGIYFEEYNNFPGAMTKFVFKTIGFQGILSLLDGKSKKAHFKTMICYKDKKEEKIFSGVWKGEIIDKISNNFNPEWEYNSIFIPEGYDKVLAEISLGERAGKSHRKKAFDRLIKFLKRKK